MKQLPTLKNFKASEAPREQPDRWWARYYSYAVFCVATTALSAGVAFWKYSGLDHQNDIFERERSFRDPAAYNRRLYSNIVRSAGGTLVIAIGFCVALEIISKKNGERA
ncbi:MAG: hypothetical protein RLZZ15_2662 [Verrucomicrobiota bacterium]|jgi:hypothetical protein